jgi:hypothetical protein
MKLAKVPKATTVRECDRRGNRCYSRDISKDIGLQMYDAGYTGGPDTVIIEILLRRNIVRKHRELIDAVFVWAKELP